MGSELLCGAVYSAWPEPDLDARRLGWELSESGFRGTAGGDLLTLGFVVEGSLDSDSFKVLCRGGGTGFLST